MIYNNNNTQLIRWFIGFMDAEGNFQTFPKKRVFKSCNSPSYYNVGYGIHLSLHIRDLSLIEFLQKELNLPGTIYKYPHRDEARLAIVKLEDIKAVIPLFDKYPLIKKSNRDNYSRLKYGVLNNINRFGSWEEYQKFYYNNELWQDNLLETQFNNLDISSINYDNWLSGFITGEGSFNIKTNGSKEFCMEQTDKNLMELVKQKFQFSPNLIIKDRRKIRPNSQITYEIRISGKKDLINLITFLDDLNHLGLNGHKLSQYLAWKPNFSKILP